MGRATTYLDLLDLVDSFPYDDKSAAAYYKLLLAFDDRPYGFLHPDIVSRMPWTKQFEVNAKKFTVRYVHDWQDSSSDLSHATSDAFRAVVDAAIGQDLFKCIGGRHSELFAIPGYRTPVSLERFATSLFGITTRGAHLTAYSLVKGQMMIWVARRSQSVGTWKGMFDSTVAGGVAAGETPFENIVREAAEEASLQEAVVRKQAKQTGVLTYMGISQGENGWEEGMALPDVVCVYDLELPPNKGPKPCDDEVQEFKLMSIEDVKKSLLAMEWKPNSAVVLLDFLIRHGVITMEAENDYVQIVQRMHRRLPFPV